VALKLKYLLSQAAIVPYTAEIASNLKGKWLGHVSGNNLFFYWE
jgi:hypothetical protein